MCSNDCAFLVMTNTPPLRRPRTFSQYPLLPRGRLLHNIRRSEDLAMLSEVTRQSESAALGHLGLHNWIPLLQLQPTSLVSLRVPPPMQ